jgi:hypothetical protein
VVVIVKVELPFPLVVIIGLGLKLSVVPTGVGPVQAKLKVRGHEVAFPPPVAVTV